MGNTIYSDERREELCASIVEMDKRGLTAQQMADKLGVPYGTVQTWRLRLRREHDYSIPEQKQKSDWTVDGEEPKKECTIVTCYQEGAKLHEGFWENLKAYAKVRNAVIRVATVRTRGDEKRVHEDVKPHVLNMNTVGGIDENRYLLLGGVKAGVTVRNPLTSIGNGTGSEGEMYRAYILPHPSIAMQMVHGINAGMARQMYSTGSCTWPEYPDTKSGFIAQSSWRPSALIIEYDYERRMFWVRQLIGCAKENGSFQDLHHYMWNGHHSLNFSSKVLVSGDCHFTKMCPVANLRLLQLLDYMKPNYHILHDIFDGESVNRHERNNRFKNYARRTHGKTKSVKDELEKTAVNLNVYAERLTFSKHVVVQSNHDDWLYDWALNHDASRDVSDMREWHMVNLDIMDSIDEKHEGQGVMERALRRNGLGDFNNIEFIGNGEGLMIDGVEYSCHGDKGLGGRPGSIGAFARVSHPVTIAHSHSPAIIGDAYRVGVCARTEMGYNVGMTDWATSCAVQYHNGTRAIITADFDGGAPVWCKELV